MIYNLAGESISSEVNSSFAKYMGRMELLSLIREQGSHVTYLKPHGDIDRNGMRTPGT